MKMWRRKHKGTGGSQQQPAIGEVIISATCTGAQDCEIYGLTATALTQGEVVDRCREAVAAQQPFVLGLLEVAKAAGQCPRGHLHQALITRDASVADGMSVAMSGPLVTERPLEREEGQGLFTDVLEEAERAGQRVFLLGATAACLAAFQERLAVRHPNLNIVGVRDGRLLDDPEERAAIVEAIRDAKSELLLVGMLASVREVVLERRIRVA